jgi:hypothetical protein
MGYVFDDVTGRIRAIFLTGTPLVPGGHTFTTDAILNPQIIDHKRDITLSLLKKRDGLKITGANAVPRNMVGQVAVQKFDGTTLADKTGAGDNDPIAYALEHATAFLSKDESSLTQGADSVKVAAPGVQGSARFLVFSPELQLLDGKVIFV